jgi:hypothetical protein
MPFAELPGSHMNVPSPPDWTRFAAQANELIASQPIPNLSESITNAVNQINQMLALNSPEAKTKRHLAYLHDKYMTETYQDYEAHPENYIMTANGPILRDPIDRYVKLAKINRDIAYARNLGHANEPPPQLIEKANLLKGIKEGKYKSNKVYNNQFTPIDSSLDNSEQDNIDQEDQNGS